jgi:glycosyltransferase involved in cell wall biosynthesis
LSASAYINGRFLNQSVTGVQRYALSVRATLEETAVTLTPKASSTLRRHYWEQAILPAKLRNLDSPLLLNLCNTAPIRYSNQIATIHDVAVFENPTWFNPLFAAYYRWMLPRIAKSAKHIVTVSHFSKLEIQKHLGVRPNDISVICPSLSSNLLNARVVKPSAVSERPFVLMVGNHDPRKHIDWAATILGEWIAQNGMQLIMLNQSSSNFKSKPNHANNAVLLLSNVNDSELKWLYQNALLLIQPSLYEGFGLVPFEARQFGTRVLLSDIPVHREVHGQNALYFASNDRNSLIEQTAFALKSLPQKAAHAYDNTDFDSSWKKLIERFS